MAPTWLTSRPVSQAVLQAHLPLGKAWAGFRIPAMIAYRFLAALGRVHQDAWTFLAALHEKLDYRTSTDMLTEWETAVGLPSKCLPRSTIDANRRAWIAFRLNKTRWNTVADWQALAVLFNVTANITPGWLVQRPAVYDAYYPRSFYNFPALGRFRVYIDLPDQVFGGYPFDGANIEDDKYPIPYGDSSRDATGFRCFIESIAPANVLIIWNEFPAIPPNGNGATFDIEFDGEYS